MNNADVRTGLDTALRRLPGVNIYRVPPDDVVAPAVIIAGFEVDNRADFSAGRRVTVELFAVVSRRNKDFIDQLDQLCDGTGRLSIEALIDDNPTLDDSVDSAVVTSVGDYREILIAETAYYAATVRVECLG